MAQPGNNTTFDYIIVGAGSAGSVLAARLSENPKISVLLLEAGGSDNVPSINMPGMLVKVVPPNKRNWSYWTEPQAHVDNRSLYWPRGKVLGGSSAINGMVYIRGHARDYDEWAQLGCTGWSYDDVLPYFKKSEGSERGAGDFHGADGPLKVTKHTSALDCNDAFLKAGEQCGHPYNDDFNGSDQEGVGWYDSTIHQGRRQNTARVFLRTAESRPNLTILTHAQARRVLLEGKKVIGVELSRKGKIKTYKAGREVVLCGGAINSPQLLQLSGIGDPDDIRAVGLDVLHERKAVGKNLQDHYDIMATATLKKPVSIYKYAMPHRGAYEIIKWLFNKPGIMSDSFTPVGSFLKTDTALERPDIQMHIINGIASEPHGMALPNRHGVGVHVCQLRPHSRGTISLKSSDPLDHAKIDPNYFSAGEDMQVMIKGLRMTLDMLNAPAFADLIDEFVIPDPSVNVKDDTEAAAVVRESGETIYHPVATCTMGPAAQATSVVDPTLKVIGIEGLRVADASVMPRLIGGNTNAPTIMIAEKCADMIKQTRAG